MTPTRSRIKPSFDDDDELDKDYKVGSITSRTTKSDSDFCVVSTDSSNTTLPPSETLLKGVLSALSARTAAAELIPDPYSKDKQKQGAEVWNYFNTCIDRDAKDNVTGQEAICQVLLKLVKFVDCSQATYGLKYRTKTTPSRETPCCLERAQGF